MVIASLLRAGYNPPIPAYTDNARYDIVLETRSGRFLRVQVKTGRWLEAQGVVRAVADLTILPMIARTVAYPVSRRARLPLRPA